MARQGTQAKSNVPIRICGSRSRSGCTTCKKRHVKCDEERPICSMCRKGYRQCIYESSPSHIPHPGPSTDQKSITAILAASQIYDYAMNPGPNRSVSPYGMRDVSEVSALKSFAAHMGQELSGHFSDHVWCYILPQVAQHEPSIWHAIVAINILDSSIRLGLEEEDNTTVPHTAIQQYSKAIRELNVVIESSEKKRCQDVVLLSCVLFAIFECLQNHYQSALRHVVSGLKLLAEWKNNSKSHDTSFTHRYFDHEIVQPIFFLLDSQAVQMGAISFREELGRQALFDEFYTPTSFSSTQEAHVSLIHLFNRISHWSMWVGPDMSFGDRPEAGWMMLEKEKIQKQLIAWDSAFEKPLKLFHPEPATVLLLLSRKVIQICWNIDLDGHGEMGWDKHNALFREAVEYAEAYMEMTTFERQTHSTQGGKSTFTMTGDIVLSLFCISVKCRHSGIRRRALKMLQICNRKEGVWDSKTCALLAEKMIAFEERCACEDGTIQESSRIYIVDVDFEEEKLQGIAPKKLVQDGVNSHHMESFTEPLLI